MEMSRKRFLIIPASKELGSTRSPAGAKGKTSGQGFTRTGPAPPELAKDGAAPVSRGLRLRG